MLLRSVTKHIREQNWSAVLIDFVIVVVGILLAFQITEWSDENDKRASEVRYLSELRRDLSSDIDELENALSGTRARFATSERILLAIAPDYEPPAFFNRPKQTPTPLAIFDGYVFAALISSGNLTGSDYTFNELVTSSNLGILSDRQLVNELAAYYRIFERRRDENVIVFNVIEPMTAFLRQRGRGMADKATFDDAIELAKQNKTFLGFVKNVYFLSLWQTNRYSELLVDAKRVRDKIDSQVHRTPTLFN